MSKPHLSLWLILGLLAPMPLFSQQNPGAGFVYEDLVVGNSGSIQRAITPAGINAAGALAGWYRDGSFANHGFLVSPTGTFTQVDHPGASWTVLLDLNDAGEALGSWGVAGPGGSGGQFTRLSDGSFATFWTPNTQTTIAGMNNQPVLSGQQVLVGWTTMGGAVHGYIFPTPGIYTLVDHPSPGAGGGPVTGTRLTDINDSGIAVGWYVEQWSSDKHGFIYDSASGLFTPLDMPGFDWTVPESINDQGVIVGQVVDFNASPQVRRAFVFDGVFHLLEVPGAAGWSAATGIGNAGDITGWRQGLHLGVSGQFGFLGHQALCQPDLGGASPGGGILSVCGDPLATGGSADLLLSGLSAGTSCWLLFAPGQTPLPFAGGTLVPDPSSLILLPFTCDNAGQVHIPGISGGGGPFTRFVQFVSHHPLTPSPWRLSNALQVDFLP